MWQWEAETSGSHLLEADMVISNCEIATDAARLRIDMLAWEPAPRANCSPRGLGSYGNEKSL